MSKTSSRSLIRMPSVEEDKAVIAAAKTDPDALPLSARQLKEMVPVQTVRGRPKSASKKLLVSVRYSAEVISYFKSTGDGWQSRMDGILLKYVAKQQSRGA